MSSVPWNLLSKEIGNRFEYATNKYKENKMSECDKDTQVFSADEYKWEYNAHPQAATLTVTRKPKKKSELKFRDITPQFDYVIGFGKIMEQPTSYFWQEKYRLVQFKLEHEGSIDENEALSKHIWFNTYSTRTYIYSTDREIRLASDAHNSWSAPVVIPIDFHNKLDCYVSDFNKKLNCGGGE